MTDAEVAVPSDRPEYSTEQVEDAKIFFTDLARWSDKVLPGAEYIRTILSALAKAGDARDEWQRTANAFAADVVGYVEEIAALRSRLESAERDTARLDFLIENADNNLRDEENGEAIVEVDAYFDEDTDRRVVEWSVMGRGFPNGGGHELGESDVGFREAIDDAMSRAHSPTPTQGGTNG
jgi:hypothetical protein